MKRVAFQTLVRRPDGTLLEGTLHGEGDVTTATVIEFLPSSAEKDGEPIARATLPHVMKIPDFTTEETAEFERLILEHVAEDVRVQDLKPHRVEFEGRPLNVYVAAFTKGSSGYFSHETGAAEGPSGPEADIVLIRDEKTDETIPVIDLDDERYGKMVEALADVFAEEDAQALEAAMPHDVDDTHDSAFYR